MKFYRINQYIRATQVRVIDENGGQLGVLTLDEALFNARQKGIDLVEVAPSATPPVCKIIDFKKFKYQEQKKEAAGRKKTKGSLGQKEIRLTPFMGEKDYTDRVKRIREFISDGHRVKIVVKFFGRQITRKEFGYRQLTKAIESVKDIARPETDPKWQGRELFVNLKPIK